MNKKITFTTLVLLVTLLTQFAVAPQKALAATCDAAQFVADVTVPDGTGYSAGQTFTKTWKLKNVGTCSWSTAYNLVFASGDQMGAPASVPFSKSVAPGQTIDLSVGMTAPNVSGTIRGYWKLKNAAGNIFGIGAAADKAFWVQIWVSTSGGTGTGYDFVQQATSAAWTSGVGTLPFPGSASDANGAGLKVDNPKLENGANAGTPGLLMVPQNIYNGFVQAQYPAYRVQSGDHFKSIINCEYSATSCYVNFRLDYQIGSNPVRTFWSFNERYEGLYYMADLNLSSLAGQDVKFILRIGAAGYATGDRALWGAPRITTAGGNPPPTVTGTPPTPTNTPIPNNGDDRATFIGENVPDGTVYAPNIGFTKTWKIKNTGRSTWTTAYKLVYVSGDRIGGPDEVPLTATIAPNTTYEFSVNLTSPSVNGHYIGYWQLKNAAGALFGIGPRADKPWWVDITVRGGSNFTPTPTPTVNGTPPTATPTPNRGPDRVTFVADVTVPDGTSFGPNIAFTKKWRMRNTGTSTWTSAYKLVFVSGEQMNAVSEKSLTSNTSPNMTVDISVDLKSPATSGSYSGYWMLQNASGQRFGIGETANQPFWVIIDVTGGSTATPTVGPSLTATPTATVTRTLVPGTITATLTRTLTPTITNTPGASVCNYARMLADVSVPDGTVFGPNTAFTKTWRIQNIGTCTWTTAYKLVFVSGSQMGGPSAINLSSTVAPNQTVELSVPLTSPAANDTYRGNWQFKNADGGLFGIGPNADTPFWVEIIVRGGGSGSTLTPTPTPTPTLTVTPTLSPTPG